MKSAFTRGSTMCLICLTAFCLMLPNIAASDNEPTDALLRNMEYKLTFGKKVKLVDGEFNDPVDMLSVRIEKVALGDLNRDKAKDAAVILAYTGGGTGLFFELTAVTYKDGKPALTAPIELGDRVGIKSLEIKQGVIIVGMIAHGPDDPSCCPTKKVIRKFVVKDGKIVRSKK